MLASGVWRLCETPRRKSSFASSRSTRRRFWSSTRAYSWALRMAADTSIANSSNRSWSARSQWRVAGRWPTTTPSCSPEATRLARIGTGSPGTVSSVGISRGSTSSSAQSIIPNATRAWSAARRTTASGRSSRLVASSATTIWRSSRLRRPRSRARRLWLSASRLNSSSPGSSRRPGSSPADTRSTDRAMARSGAPRSAASSAASRTANTTDTAMASSSTRATAVSESGRPGHQQEHDPEPGDREDRGGDQGERQPRPETEPGAAIDRRRVDAPLAVLGLCVVDRRQLGRSPGLGGAASGLGPRDPVGQAAAVRVGGGAGRRRDQVRSRSLDRRVVVPNGEAALVRREVGVAHRGASLAPTSR